MSRLDWEKLGNKGWNLDNLAKHSAKSASLVVSSVAIVMIKLDAPCRFVPAALSTPEAARQGVGAETGTKHSVMVCLLVVSLASFTMQMILYTHPPNDVDIKVQEAPSPTALRTFPSLSSAQTLHNISLGHCACTSHFKLPSYLLLTSIAML